MEQIIELIKEKFETKKPFSSVVKNFDSLNLDDPNILRMLMWSAYFFYFQGDGVHTNKVLNILISNEFDGNYDKWTWIEGGILLKIEMEPQRKQELISLLLDTLDFGEDEQKNKLKHKTFQRRLLGQLLNKDKIVSAQNANDMDLTLLYSIPYYKELLFVEFVGQNEKLSEDEIQDEKNWCQQIIQKIIN